MLLPVKHAGTNSILANYHVLIFSTIAELSNDICRSET
jgi:hypothetical protein